MAPYTNSFFSNTTGYSGEQNLLDDLTREQIAIYGIDLSYLPRKMLNLDKLLHESSVSAFEVALNIPMYVKSFDGYDNGMELLTKFGVRSSDQVTLQMSRSQFETFYKPYLAEYYEANGGLDRLEGTIDSRPKEGDLIHFPLDDSIFEIKYVQFDTPFFQLGTGYIYELQCERFEYSGENFSTGIEEIDDTVRSDFYKLDIVLESGGTGTFVNGETFTIRGSNQVAISDETGLVLTTEDGQQIFEDPADLLNLYGDSGYLRDVWEVTGLVNDWNLPDLKLLASDFTNVDPDKQDPTTKDVATDLFVGAIITGNQSGASYTIESISQTPKPFDDSEAIQTEFDRIKIIDPSDTDPFGFY